MFRYVVVKVDLQNEKATNVAFTDTALYNCITRCVQKYYGDVGAASIRFGLKCKYANEQTRIAIIRIKHRIHRFVTSILPMASVVSQKRFPSENNSSNGNEFSVGRTHRQISDRLQWSNDNALQ